MTIEELQKERERAIEFIAYATETLKGHMFNTERALMVADRKDAREYLEKVTVQIGLLALTQPHV